MEDTLLRLESRQTQIPRCFCDEGTLTCRILPNTTGRIKKSLHELIGDETENAVSDHSQIMYHRPIEK